MMKTLIYSVRAEIRRQLVPLWDLSWERVHWVTLCMPAGHCGRAMNVDVGYKEILVTRPIHKYRI